MPIRALCAEHVWSIIAHIGVALGLRVRIGIGQAKRGVATSCDAFRVNNVRLPCRMSDDSNPNLRTIMSTPGGRCAPLERGIVASRKRMGPEP